MEFMLLFLLPLVLGTGVFQPRIDLACMHKKDGYIYREDTAKNCRQHSVCIKGQIYTVECTLGFSFDPSDGACDTTFNHLCETQYMCPLDVKDVLFAKVGSCSEYYECNNGTIALKQCPIGLEFDVDTESCEQVEVPGNCISCPNIDNPKQNITIPSDNSCNQ